MSESDEYYCPNPYCNKEKLAVGEKACPECGAYVQKMEAKELAKLLQQKRALSSQQEEEPAHALASKELVRRWFEESNNGKVAAIAVTDELCSTDFIMHGSDGEDIRGINDYKQFLSEFFNAFPDLHFTLDDIIVEGDKVATRYTMTCTHKGVFMGVPPTNKKITLWTIEIASVAGGKFVEGWARTDTLGLMQQLGIVPTPKK